MNWLSLTDEEVTLILSTFKARFIAIGEWISEARKADNMKEVEHWEDILSQKKELEKKIRLQAGRSKK